VSGDRPGDFREVILGSIALIGMFAYVYKFGMNQTASAMLSGLFGMLLLRVTRDRKD
jgi:hypothetical protein